MINHDSLNLLYGKGIQLQPSEEGNLKVPCSFRQFINQVNRAYSFSALDRVADAGELNLTDHYPDSNYAPYFNLKIIIQPHDKDTSYFYDEEINDFYNCLLTIIGNSDFYNFKGDRPVFIGEMHEQQDPHYGNVLKGDILVGTSIFYNDYSVTTHFPETDSEHKKVVESIYYKILEQYPQLHVSLEYETIIT